MSETGNTSIRRVFTSVEEESLPHGRKCKEKDWAGMGVVAKSNKLGCSQPEGQQEMVLTQAARARGMALASPLATIPT